MARNINGGSDRITLVDPVGVTVAGPWTFGIMLRPLAVNCGLVKVGPNDASDMTRGLLLHIDGSGRLQFRAAGGVTSNTTTTTVDAEWNRITVVKVASGDSTVSIGQEGTQVVSQAFTPPALAAGDAINIGVGHTPFGINVLSGDVARFFWIDGVGLSHADANAIFDDFAAAVAEHGTDIKLLNYIAGDTAPEPDYRTPGTNSFAITGTTQVADPIGIPSGGDTTAPTLSNATASATGSTTASGSVDTDEGNGTLYRIASEVNSAPDVTQIQAGQDGTGVAAAASGSQAVSAPGTQNVTFTGLAPNTAHYVWYQHRDAADPANDSAVISGGSFTTDPPPDLAPVVEIDTPAGSITVSAGTTIAVSATATDAVDGDLSASIAWESSDADDGTAGALGDGAALLIDTTGWSEGARTITASVEDSSQNVGADSFTLNIGAAPEPTLIAEDDMEAVRQSGVATVIRVPLRDPTTGALVASNPLAPGDVLVSVDGAAAAALADDANAASWAFVNGRVEIPLSAAEVTGSEITMRISDASGSAFSDKAVTIAVVAYNPLSAPADGAAVATAVRSELATELGRVDVAVSSRSSLTAAGVRTELATELGRIDAGISSRATPANVTAAETSLANAIAALNNLSAADVNAEVDQAIVDAALATAAALAQTQTDLEEAISGVSTGGITAGEIATAVRNELTTELGRLDASVSTRATPANVADAQTAIGNAISALNNLSSGEVASLLGLLEADILAAIPSANANADALLDRNAAIEGLTMRQMMRVVAAVLFGKVTGAGGATVRFRDVADTKDRVVATVDDSGNRSLVVLDSD